MGADLYFLIEYPIYRDFEAEDIEVLSGLCEDKSYSDKETIVKEGDPGDAMFIIKKGSVKIYKETKNRRKLIALISEGEFFGEMTLIDSSPRSATVVANGPAELVRFSTRAFNEIKTNYSKTGFKVVGVLLKFMSHRIRRTTKKAASLLKGRRKKKKASKKTARPRKKKK